MDILINGPISSVNINDVLLSFANDKQIGGYASFFGQVRADIIDNKIVNAIEYSAYPEMIQTIVDEISNVIRDKYKDIMHIIIRHSIGLVSAGEISLFVVVSSFHRGYCFQALEETVELIKSKLPVWKKEIFNDNSYRWIE